MQTPFKKLPSPPRPSLRSTRTVAFSAFLLFSLTLLPLRQLWAFSGSEGASFLDIPVGGGPAAMGGAYTAQAADAYAPVWNPAGLGFLPSTQIAGQHLAYLETIHYEFLSAVHPLKAGGALGFSTQYLGSGDIPETDKDGFIVGTYGSHYASYNVSYGRKYSRKLSLGVTGKLIEARINDASAHAFAADLGAFYRANDQLDLGASLTNAGTQLKFVDQGDPLPMAMHLGAAFWPTPHWNTSAEFVYRRYGLASFHTAVEWHPLSLLSLRTGYRTDTVRELSAMAGLTTGIGFHLWNQEFDYAWLPVGDLGATHYFSLVIRFWQIEVPNPKRNLIHYSPVDPSVVRRHREGTLSDEESASLMLLLSDPHEEHLVKKQPSGGPVMQLDPNVPRSNYER